MISAHQISFVAATVFNIISFTLYQISRIVKNKERVSTTTLERLWIAQMCFDYASIFSWFIVHCLMLLTYLKYGKPLEDNQ